MRRRLSKVKETTHNKRGGESMTGFEVLILINTIFIVWIMFELKEIKQQLTTSEERE